MEWGLTAEEYESKRCASMSKFAIWYSVKFVAGQREVDFSRPESYSEIEMRMLDLHHGHHHHHAASVLAAVSCMAK